LFRIVRLEVYKLFHDKKFYSLLGVMATFSLMLAAGLKVSGPDRGGLFSFYGQNLPYYSLSFVAAYLAPILSAVLVSGFFADEYENGTLKLPLLRPVKRWEFLMAKAAAAAVGILSLLAVSMITSYLMGTLLLGWGEGLKLYGKSYGGVMGVITMIKGHLAIFFPLLAMGIFVLFLSNVIPRGSIVVGIALGVHFAMGVAGIVFQQIDPFLLNAYYSIGEAVFQPDQGAYILRGIGVSVLYIVIFGGLNLRVISKKDITT